MKYEYLVASLDDTFEDLEFAATEDEADAIAARLCRNSIDIGIWKLQRVGRKESITWTQANGKEFTGNRHYQPWTTAETEFLLDERHRGTSYREIAEHLGRTIRAVEVYASRLGH